VVIKRPENYYLVLTSRPDSLLILSSMTKATQITYTAWRISFGGRGQYWPSLFREVVLAACGAAASPSSTKEHDHDDGPPYFFDDCPTDLVDGGERAFTACLKQHGVTGLGKGPRLWWRRAADGSTSGTKPTGGAAINSKTRAGAFKPVRVCDRRVQVSPVAQGSLPPRFRRVSKLHDPPWRHTGDQRVQRCTVGEPHRHFVAEPTRRPSRRARRFCQRLPRPTTSPRRMIRFVRYLPPPQQTTPTEETGHETKTIGTPLAQAAFGRIALALAVALRRRRFGFYSI